MRCKAEVERDQNVQLSWQLQETADDRSRRRANDKKVRFVELDPTAANIARTPYDQRSLGTCVRKRFLHQTVF